MLILCVGMYRACSTWQYGVAAELLERHRGGRRLGYADGDQFVAEIEPTLDPAGWSVLKAHNAHGRFAERIAEGRALAIYSHRDLRDVTFSWMHKTGVTFPEIVERDFLHLCLHNDWFWRGRPGVLLQSYEDLIADPARGVREIADHLGIALEPGEAAAIAEALSLESNRKRTADLSERLQAEGIPLDSKDLNHYDRQTLLHWNHVRSGRAGAWRDVATPEQKATIARICGPWLVARGYEPDQSWAFPLEWEPPEARLPRVSHARNGEDVLLDRLFRGRVGTYVALGAEHPSVGNPTYYFYLRGWRGVNVEPAGSPAGLFSYGRPEDVNVRPAGDPDSQARAVADLIGRGDLVPPDLFSIADEAEVGPVLGQLPLSTWRPGVFVVAAPRPAADAPGPRPWEPFLLDQGYRFAAFDGINRFYLRGDLAAGLPLLEAPVNALDAYTRAETVEQRERADALQATLDDERRRDEEARVALAVDVAVLKARLGEELESRHRDYLGWLDERAAWQAERAAWQAERAAWLAEREERQAERIAAQGERDALARRVVALEAARAALAREVDALHGVIGRLQGEIAARDLEIDQTRTRLRAYLKVDRLGVVPALQRKVHAHRAHRGA